MPDGSFTFKDLGATIAKILGLNSGEDVEIQRDRTDPNRVLVIRRPKPEAA